MEKNGVDWPSDNGPVVISELGGNSLTKHEASAFLKESGLRFFGVILDADDDVDAAWQKVQGWFDEWITDMPNNIPVEGFISPSTYEGIRFGVWIMPDNLTQGMLETFLQLLVHDNDKELWAFAESTSHEARTKFNAPFKLSHEHKASMHTFLAWQDEPGAQLHEAIDRAMLDPTSSQARPFVEGFRNLFQV
jgi:hypothetical protein